MRKPECCVSASETKTTVWMYLGLGMETVFQLRMSPEGAKMKL